MRTWLPLLVLALLNASEAAGQGLAGSSMVHSPETGAQARPNQSYVTVAEQPTGEPILVIHYPWKVHARPSIEVCVLPEDEAEWSAIPPLFFLDRFFTKERIMEAVYRCLDDSEEVPTTGTFAEQDIDFEILGDRNSFGKPSVCVACRTPVPEIKRVLARALFFLLDPWAVDKRTLYLDLPPEHFAESGKIRVWFLRGDTVLWSETVAWPGFSE